MANGSNFKYNEAFLNLIYSYLYCISVYIYVVICSLRWVKANNNSKAL